MVTSTKPKPAETPAPPTLGRALEDQETAALKRPGAVRSSPLNDLVSQALTTVGDDGSSRAFGVEVTDEYPESTIYAHLKKSETQLDLRTRGLKLKTWNKASGSNANKDWPHIAFKIVPVPVKAEPASD